MYNLPLQLITHELSCIYVYLCTEYIPIFCIHTVAIVLNFPLFVFNKSYYILILLSLNKIQ